MLLKQEEMPTSSLHGGQLGPAPGQSGRGKPTLKRSVDCPLPAQDSRHRPSLPEIVPPTELPAQLVVEATPHLAQATPAEVTAQTVLMPVLVDGLQEVAVPDVLLAAAACQQGRGDLQHFIHWLPGEETKH